MAIVLMKCLTPVLLLLLCNLILESSGISPDGEALLSFKTAIVGSDDILVQWKQEDPDPCRWKGVKCDAQTKRVISLLKNIVVDGKFFHNIAPENVILRDLSNIRGGREEYEYDSYSLRYVVCVELLPMFNFSTGEMLGGATLPEHKLSGSISPDIGKLNHLKLLVLYNNNLYGTIPSELGNCTELQTLYLQGNFLSGLIPAEIGDLTELEYMDISSNSLSGPIPSSLGKLSKLSIFNVSTNFFIGPLPSEGALIKFTENSFVGNRGLCGKQISLACPGGPSRESQPPVSENHDGKKKYSTKLLISASATVGALLLVALMCFWGCFLYKKFGKNDSNGLAISVSGGASIVMFHGDLPYSSKDIIKKLETLNEEHIIGTGGFGTVYKLAMDDGNVFAVKRIMKTNYRVDRFFERELEILGSIKHRYLVNLRGYCNSPSSKLLLYDFLPGGSLDEALHDKSEQLDWDARLNIIMGAAKGLQYLHHDCSPRIIHRDIKSSNILLDGNLEARVSDFGFAKLLEDEESHITTICCGTFGYLAPDCGGALNGYKTPINQMAMANYSISTLPKDIFLCELLSCMF
ncbi:hypothetical protein GIB67_012187 [Kingdonia uniflora]|uniref:non-specific serine/threonine protein kinase n=1 Tax=Kingdonia uniflora TaxID=39325 RepID=A0A7J7NNM9_9MAGN|nr:hypothetical protein GIB67_012187 [Kingdonia uniflora]